MRISAILLQPIIPTKAAELLDRLGVEEDERGWDDAVWDGMKGEHVDVGVIRGKLESAGEKWKGKGPLFPPVSI